MTDIVERLRTSWPTEFALQPQTSADRKNVIEVQTLKVDAANEIEALREAAPCIHQGFHLGRGALLMLKAAVVIERLAPMEPDIEVSPGEN